MPPKRIGAPAAVVNHVATGTLGWDHSPKAGSDEEVCAMFKKESRNGRGIPSGVRRSGSFAQEMIDRAQDLADTPRPVQGYPLEWLVEAKHVGDMTAIAILALRSSSR